MKTILVVLVDGDAVCAYPFEPEDAKKVSELRAMVKEACKDLHAHDRFNGKPQIRCQLVGVDMPACSPDGFFASIVNDIMDKVTT
jgi:hypothetical protein